MYCGRRFCLNHLAKNVHAQCPSFTIKEHYGTLCTVALSITEEQFETNMERLCEAVSEDNGYIRQRTYRQCITY
eukprot:56762-Eustigmatos_ZCMA.PRE.2